MDSTPSGSTKAPDFTVMVTRIRQTVKLNPERQLLLRKDGRRISQTNRVVVGHMPLLCAMELLP